MRPQVVIVNFTDYLSCTWPRVNSEHRGLCQGFSEMVAALASPPTRFGRVTPAEYAILSDSITVPSAGTQGLQIPVVPAVLMLSANSHHQDFFDP